jgi:hypothetical protein
MVLFAMLREASSGGGSAAHLAPRPSLELPYPAVNSYGPELNSPPEASRSSSCHVRPYS